MEINKIKEDIKSFIEKEIPNIECCCEDKRIHESYLNIDSMYNNDESNLLDITYFNDKVDELSIKLNIDYSIFNKLFINKIYPSKGLLMAIALVLDYSLCDLKDLLNKFSYKLINNDTDKIVNYFFINNIRDIELLNNILVSFGLMYLYSKTKPR